MTHLRPLLLFLLVLSCGACSRVRKVDEQAVFAVVNANLQAMQREDADGVMATLHSEIKDRDEVKAAYVEVFRKYDLKFSVSDLKVIDAQDDEVQVRFTQKTESLGGHEPFADNLVEGVHTLKKDGGSWKLLRTTQTKIIPLSSSQP